MSFLSFLFRGASDRQKANRRTNKAMRRLGRPVREVSEGRWEVVQEPPLQGYLISLQAWEFPDRAEFMAFADVVIDRDWYQRGMALWLLEENDKLRCGSLRLIETREGLTLAVGRVCEFPLYTEVALSRVAAELLSETSRVIQKLLAMEFISRRTGGEQSPSK